jgi:hypothetical protein
VWGARHQDTGGAGFDNQLGENMPAEAEVCGIDDADLSQTTNQEVCKQLSETVAGAIENLDSVDVKYGVYRRFPDSKLVMAISTAQAALLLLQKISHEESIT